MRLSLLQRTWREVFFFSIKKTRSMNCEKSIGSSETEGKGSNIWRNFSSSKFGEDVIDRISRLRRWRSGMWSYMSLEKLSALNTLSDSNNQETVLRISKLVGKSFIGFWSVHFFADRILKDFLRIPLQHFPIEDQFLFPEKLTNLAHSAMVVSLAYKSIFRDRDFASDNLFVYKSETHDRLFSIASAYQLYDLSLMLFQKRDLGKLFHHCVAFFGSICMPFFRQSTFYPTAFVFSYLTYWPTNIAWLLSALRLNGPFGYPKVYRVILWVRLLSFLFFRLLLGPLIILIALRRNDLHRLKSCHWLPRILAPFNVVSLSILNAFWTRDALQALTRRSSAIL